MRPLQKISKTMYFSELFNVNLTPNWRNIELCGAFADLAKTPQSKKYHHEGNALSHTILVTDAMHNFIDQMPNRPYDYKLTLMAAALCHDLGKATTTSFDEAKQDYSCKNHGAESEKIVRRLFSEEDPTLLNNVCSLVRNHMVFHHIFDGDKDINKILIKMSLNRMTITEHILMNLADKLGTVNDFETEENVKAHGDKITELANELGILDKPYQFPSIEERRKFFNEKDNKEIADFTMYVMIGLPGSGKNYYIEHNLFDIPSISRDDIRTKIGIQGVKPQGNKEQEEYVTQLFNDDVIKCCKEGKSFVINNTNVKRQYRDGYKRLVKQYNPKVVYILMETNIKTCKERREGLMPMSVIDNMSKNFEYPHPSEYDKIVIV